MDGMKLPQFAGVKHAVGPVADEITDQKNLEHLKPLRLAGERSKTLQINRIHLQAKDKHQKNKQNARGKAYHGSGN